jgi:hypothetical protein
MSHWLAVNGKCEFDTDFFDTHVSIFPASATFPSIAIDIM